MPGPAFFRRKASVERRVGKRVADVQVEVVPVGDQRSERKPLAQHLFARLEDLDAGVEIEGAPHLTGELIDEQLPRFDVGGGFIPSVEVRADHEHVDGVGVIDVAAGGPPQHRVVLEAARQFGADDRVDPDPGIDLTGDDLDPVLGGGPRHHLRLRAAPRIVAVPK